MGILKTMNSDEGVFEVAIGIFIIFCCISTFISLKNGVVDGYRIYIKVKRADSPILY